MDKQDKQRAKIDKKVAKWKAKGKLQPMLKGVTDKDPLMRAACIRALGELGDKEALQHLVKALNDKDITVRMHAVEALGEMDDPRLVKLFVKLTGDKQKEIREAAAIALAKRGDLSAFDSLAETLRSGSLDNKLTVIYIMGTLEDERAIDPLLEALADPEDIVRLNVAKTLSNFLNAKVIATLKKVSVEEMGEVRQAMEKALRNLTLSTKIELKTTKEEVSLLLAGIEGRLKEGMVTDEDLEELELTGLRLDDAHDKVMLIQEKKLENDITRLQRFQRRLWSRSHADIDERNVDEKEEEGTEDQEGSDAEAQKSK